MKKKKRLISLAVCLIIILAISSIAYAYSGSDYTSDSALATKFDNLFQGKAAVFSNVSTTFKVGSSLNNSTEYKWKNNSYSGYQCYAFGNAVYYYLFGDVPFHGDGGYKNSKLVSGVKGLSELSYKTLSEAGVGCGAYIRTTTKSNGNYNGNAGHSMIILSYNEKTITVYHGNADGKGLVTISTTKWADFNKAHLSGRSRYVSHIIQPNSTAGVIATPKPASSFAFQNVVYPKTFKINTTVGWYLTGGTLICDKNLKTITTVITTADGKNVSGPKTHNISGYSYDVINLDTKEKSDNGVKFSYIKTAGEYKWILTATDESGRELKLEMPFTVVSSGSTSTDKAGVAYHTHTVVADAAVAATCTTAGLTEGKHCSTCGEVLVAQTVVAALGHQEAVDAAVAATCTTDGLTEGKHCSRCGEVLVAQTTVQALGHKEVVDKAVAATCTTDGLTEGSHCSVCNTVIKKQEKVAALGHKEVIDKAVAATYTSTGLTEGKHCERCGEVLVAQKEIAKLVPQTPEEKIEAFVTRCYKLILNRDPDADGLQSWCKTLKEKTATAAQIIDGFVRSGEFIDRKVSAGDSVDILYKTMLDREADEGGKTGWVAALNQGYTLQNIIDGFCESAEFTGLCKDYGIEPGRVGAATPAAADTPRGKIEAFVRRCYKLILSREADEGGLKGWSDALEQRVAPAAKIIDGFVQSPEYVNRKLSNGESVDILYKTMLDREADTTGKAGWVAALSQGYTLQHIINGFCGSAEFTGICNDYGITPGKLAVSGAMVKREAITPEGDEAEAPVVYQGYNSEFINEEKIRAFVEHCYKAVFGREGDAEGIENYTKLILDGKKTPKKVAYEFVFSPEFQNNLPGNEDFIRILYRLYFNREADAEGLAGWVQMLESGATLEEIVNGFAASAEFKAIVNDMKN